MIRLHNLIRAAAIGALLAAAPAARAQDSAATPAVEAPAQGNGLPAGMGVPRTLRSYTHVFVAFSVAWLLVFGYTVVLSRRFRKLEEQVEALSRDS